jgi:predicted nucleic acid-binding protein
VIVVDASAALAALLNDGEARAVLAVEALHAPHLVDAEVAHVMRRRAAAGVLDDDDAWRALDAWRRLGVRRQATTPHLERVWELRHNVSAYDAAYVSLAEALGCALLTADARLAAAPAPRCTISLATS